ncbi:MAG: hypothetical protein OEZ15_07935 [Gammaproteobacteria bacterium]|nr:hypothetical protein [Gammaproteobacteria bacterium]
MKRISINLSLISLSVLALQGCVYNCSCEDPVMDHASTQAPVTLPKGQQLINECNYISEAIIDSELLAKKMANSRFAVYYQAMSRDRVISLEVRAREIGCK